MGLYNQVVPDGVVLATATALAQKLAQGPRDALAATKDALNQEAGLDLEAALAHEAEVQARLMQGPDFREGHTAFVEKRAPKFP